jgi:hypothetical protein
MTAIGWQATLYGLRNINKNISCCVFSSYNTGIFVFCNIEDQGDHGWFFYSVLQILFSREKNTVALRPKAVIRFPFKVVRKVAPRQ